MVCMQQQTFLKWYEAKKAADPAFGDKTIFIDITSFNQASTIHRPLAAPSAAPSISSSSPWAIGGGAMMGSGSASERSEGEGEEEGEEEVKEEEEEEEHEV